MTSFGGVKTTKAQVVLGSGDHNVLVGGGEVIGAGWYSMWSSRQPTWMDPVVKGLGAAFPRALRELVGRRASGGCWEFPFLPDLDCVKRLGFNAVGASHSSGLPVGLQRRIWEIVGRSDATTVRDRVSAELASKFGLDVKVVPDSASTVFDLARFSKLRALAPVGGGGGDGAVVVQMSLQWADNCSDATIESLSEIGNRSGGLILLAVGLAGGHSDQVGLRKIASRLKCPAKVQIPESVDDIVERIALASTVIATSLHVNITAMAGGVRLIPLSGVGKLESYIDTWGFDHERPVDGPELLECFSNDHNTKDAKALIDRAGRLGALGKAAIVGVTQKCYQA